MTINEILQYVESNEMVLDFRFSKSKIPMYLYVRFMLLQHIIDGNFGLSNSSPKLELSLFERTKYIVQTFVNNIFFAPKKDILIFSTGIVNNLEDGVFVNRLYDSFCSLCIGDTQIFETSAKMKYLLPKKRKVYFIDIIDVLSIGFSKIIPISKKDKTEVNNFIHYLDSLGIEHFDVQKLDNIRKKLLGLSVRINVSYLLYKAFFKFKFPKLIIVEDGHYGGKSHIFKVAHELGIRTAEYQHGYIGLAHPAYNFHQNIVGNVESFLPEYLLTHGRYWSERIRIPAKKIEVGFPGLTEKISKYNLNVESHKKRILFISGGTVPDKLNTLVKDILPALVSIGFEVFIRAHPLEASLLEERYGELISMGVMADTCSLYDSLAQSNVVVSLEVSTVLYEAVYFCGEIYMANSEYTMFYEPNPVFLTFNNGAELLDSIQSQKKIQYPPSYFWEPDWSKKYRDFITSAIGT